MPLTTSNLGNRYLTEVCKSCLGSGKRTDEKHWLNGEECPLCRGLGLVPNREGEEILELVKLRRM